MPQICLTAPELGEERLQRLGIERQDFTRTPVWVNRTNSSWNEDQILQGTLTKLSDIGNETLLKIYKRIAPNNDQYVTDTFTSNDIVNGSKIVLLSIDYYFYLGGIFCFDLTVRVFPYGIERLYVYTQQNLVFFIISPGNFYNSERKKMSFTLKKVLPTVTRFFICIFNDNVNPGVPLGLQDPTRPQPQPLLQHHRWERGRLQIDSHQCTMSYLRQSKKYQYT